MPDIDLTEAVNAAAERHYMTLISREMEKAHAANHTFSFMPWDDLPAANRHRFAETILPAINVAAPLIAQQVLTKLAADLGPQGLIDEHMLYEEAATYIPMNDTPGGEPHGR